MKTEILVRLALVDILNEILEEKHSLTAILPHYLANFNDARDQALIQFCAYGICRDFFRLDFIIKKLSSKPIKDKNIYYLLLIGIYQLNDSRIPNFAVVNTLVNSAKKLKLFSAGGFINGILREYLRTRSAFESNANPSIQYSHPQWLIEKLQQSWPEKWQEICAANNQLPPMWLRINRLKISPENYLSLLQEKNIDISMHHGVSVCLKNPVNIADLPGFSQGYVSIQDAAAQFSAELLDLHANQMVLDACAAPGGKTCHILETEPELTKVIAVEKDQQRTVKIQQNLQRLELNAEVIVADATQPETWWDNQMFDRILIDAPCSATGVIRRHPDIKILRQVNDIENFAHQQLKLLHALWPLLKPQGKLLYVTCSILPEENEMLIANFCQQTPNAQYLPITLPYGKPTPHGHQLFPGEQNMDGFFYTTLLKN